MRKLLKESYEFDKPKGSFTAVSLDILDSNSAILKIWDQEHLFMATLYTVGDGH